MQKITKIEEKRQAQKKGGGGGPLLMSDLNKGGLFVPRCDSKPEFYCSRFPNTPQ